MTDRWTQSAVARLLNFSVCPRCGESRIQEGVCQVCKADLRGDTAIELAEASRSAVALLEQRQSIIDRLPTADPIQRAAAQPDPYAGYSAAPIPVRPDGTSTPTVPLAPPSLAAPAQYSSSSQLSLQSVLAVAGAGLFAVAAIFFTFLSPELEGQQDLRSIIVAATTVVFLVGAWLLTRAGLAFSGETVGALGMVFVAIDVWSVTRYAHDPVDAWTAGAIATLVAGAVLIAIALLARIRTWLWTGVVALALVPAFFGYGAAHDWYSILGHVGTGFAAIAIVTLLPLLAGRFSRSLGAERVTLVILRLLVVSVVVVQLVAVAPPAPLDQFLSAAAVVLALAVIAALSTRDSLPAIWSFGAGSLAAIAAAIVPVTWSGQLDDSWFVALIPVAALAALTVLVLVVQVAPRAGRFQTLVAVVGAWIVTVAFAVPAGLLALILNVTTNDMLGIDESSIATLLGVTVPFAAGALVAVLAPRLARTERTAAAVRTIAASSAVWFGMYAVLTLSSLSVLTVEARLSIGILAAVIVAIVVWKVGFVSRSPLSIRVPLVLGAHVLLLHAFVQAWPERVPGTIAQVAIIAAIVLVSFTVARVVRPVHIGVALALALLVFSGALLEYSTLTVDVVVSLTATLGLVAAIAATLVSRLRNEYWYAALVVSAIPFTLALGWRVVDDTAWTALPAGTAALLGIALLVFQRPGDLAVLRALGAAIIVPALAVVTIGIVPALTAGSGSPIVLPIVAGIVALVLPFTVAVGRVLESLGISVDDARAARLALEASSLVTAGVAVVIALFRAAAGFDTTFLVLAIVGLGGAATALFSGRRYGWVITYSTWTGALWCLFALWGVDVLEPYVLPPAIAAALIGGVAVFRRRHGEWMVIVGLVVGAVPTLGLLAAQRGDDLAVAWRLWGLLGASVVLLLLGFAFSRLDRLSSLRVPALATGILAAAGGAVHAANLGRARSFPGVEVVTADILPMLGLAALAAGLAAVGARLIAPTSSRWLYAPAMVYLLFGTAPGIRHDPVSVWTLYGLMVLFLVGMLVVVARTRTHHTTLAPVWFWFALAWVAGVVSWSQREILRVEGYSITMAAALIAAGLIAWRSRDLPASPNSWPVGFSGSWPLLGPGLFVLFVPSILATFTTPETWRAVFVIVLALIAILLGSRLKLAALFVGGIAVLPLENVFVFAVQSSRNVYSTPWWITLASAGAVLLVIAVTAERRTSGGGIAARIRDLD